MKNIIFVAAPAAGKGTISAKVCTEYNIYWGPFKK